MAEEMSKAEWERSQGISRPDVGYQPRDIYLNSNDGGESPVPSSAVVRGLESLEKAQHMLSKTIEEFGMRLNPLFHNRTNSAGYGPDRDAVKNGEKNPDSDLAQAIDKRTELTHRQIADLQTFLSRIDL